MADSPAHRFGQIIGELLEMAVEPFLQTFADEHHLYLDKKGPRQARPGVKLTWKDVRGNKHDLDFVLEKNGNSTRIGTPAAFIETAWRRYARHSKNKAQEIEGAIMSLVETYSDCDPFYGTILAGIFTQSSLTQLASLGFTILYFPYESILQAFNVVNIDASSDDSTLDSNFALKVAAWEALSHEQKVLVASTLIGLHAQQVAEFVQALKSAVLRQVEAVRVIPLFGTVFTLPSIDEAVTFFEGYDQSTLPLSGTFIKYQVEIRYVSGKINRLTFPDKASALKFLNGHEDSKPLAHEQLSLFDPNL